MNVITMPTNTTTNQQTPPRSRGFILDELAREQAIIDDANETDVTEELAADLNNASFRNRGERNMFKNDYRRHKKNIASGNRFYQ